jgi:hypothetical protein
MAEETATNGPLHTGRMTVPLTAVFLTLQHSYHPEIENPLDQRRNCMTLVQQHPRNKIETAVKCLQAHHLLLLLCPLDRTTGTHLNPRLLEGLRTFCPAGPTPNRGHVSQRNVRWTMVIKVVTIIEDHQMITAVWIDLGTLRVTVKHHRDVADAQCLAAGLRRGCLRRLIPESGLEETTGSMMNGQCEHRLEMHAHRLYDRQHGTLENPGINAIDPILVATLHRLQWSLDGCLRTHLLLMITALIDVSYHIRVKVLSAMITAHHECLQPCHPQRQTGPLLIQHEQL